FFSSRSREDFERMAKTNEYFEEAYDTLVKLSADEQKKLEYFLREKALKDYNSQMSYERNQGIQRGIEWNRNQYNQLILKLAEDGRSHLLVEAAADPELMQKLFEEYHLQQPDEL
ncbi:MAG: hypothetical protein KH452_11995, partial [Clostridiales bacterium]|nr:hypothetical protein [Clostridiales bacterium]